MALLAIVPKHASEAKPGDAAEFLREARAWLKMFPEDGNELVIFDNKLPPKVRARALTAQLERFRGRDFRAVGFFMHGLRDSIQTGHTCNIRRQPGYAPVVELAETLRAIMAAKPIVPLYACDAARDGNLTRADDKDAGPGGDDGFADGLRDAMIALDHVWARDGHVDAHITPGHTTTNKFVRRFRCNPLPHELTLGMVGGDWIVDPRDRKLWAAWNKALGSPARKGTLRLRFPFLTVRQIHAELGG